MTACGDYRTDLWAILNRTVSTNDLEDVAKRFAQGLVENGKGRYRLEKLENPGKVDEMVGQLFTIYNLGIKTSGLLQAEFFQGALNVNPENEPYKELLRLHVIPAQIEACAKNSSEILGNALIITYLCDFYATITDPRVLKLQSDLLEEMPFKFGQILITGRQKLGKELMAALKGEKLSKSDIQEIANGVFQPGTPYQGENKSISYFISSYNSLVQEGQKHADIFKNSLGEGLMYLAIN